MLAFSAMQKYMQLVIMLSQIDGVKLSMRFLALLATLVLFSGCNNAPSVQILKITGPTMGTQYHISWVGSDPSQTKSLQQQVDDRLKAINQSMSTYISDSELSLLNKGELPIDENGWMPISADLTEVLNKSLMVWQGSHGVFDVTVGPLVNLWGFGPQARPNHTPEASRITELLSHIGSQNIELDAPHSRVRLKTPQYIDLSAIAKGWAVDEIARLLKQNQITAFMVEIGGEIQTSGLKPNNQPWRIAIERPEQLLEQSIALVIPLHDLGVATSGDYRNYFEEEGVRYSHTIDPATGYPIKHKLASVTVLHQETGMADAWATAITVAGPERGLALAEEQGLAVYLLIGEGNTFKEIASTKFHQLFPQVLGGGK